MSHLRSHRSSSMRRHFNLVEQLERRVLLSVTFTSVAAFQGKVSGSRPSGLILDGAGNLFGTTTNGGPKKFGTVFKIAAGTNVITTLVTFDGDNGMSPRGNLVLDGSGNLFGTTTGGGDHGVGTVFEIAAGSVSILTTLASFDGTNGAYPISGLVVDASGNLFGTSMGAGDPHRASTVFELASGSSTITVLGTFAPRDRLTGSLAIDSSGTIFGTTNSGGSSKRGTLFQIAGSAHTLTTRVTFRGNNGTGPDGSLLLDSGGNLFGMTAGGGGNSAGTLFKLPATASEVTTLASFGNGKGRRPIGTLIMDADGNLFGVTATGGSKDQGTVYERPAGSTNSLTTLFNFTGASTGFNPTGPLVTDGAGNLWGTTFQGGPNNAGIVFKLHDDTIVFAPQPSQLAFGTTPASIIAGQTFSLQVKLENAQGQVVNVNAPVTLQVTSGPEGGGLTGTLTVNSVQGVATFSNLTLTQPGTYNLLASSGVLNTTLKGVVVGSVARRDRGALEMDQWVKKGTCNMPQETKAMPQNPDDLETAAGTVHEKLEGWVPALASEEEIRMALEKAFDYRGDVTITKKDGAVIEGYIFDRRAGATLAASAVRLFPKDQNEKLTIRYNEIAALAFSGRDTAAGKSWETWLKKYQEKKAAGEKNIGIEPEKLD